MGLGILGIDPLYRIPFSLLPPVYREGRDTLSSLLYSEEAEIDLAPRGWCPGPDDGSLAETHKPGSVGESIQGIYSSNWPA